MEMARHLRNESNLAPQLDPILPLRDFKPRLVGYAVMMSG